MKSYGNIVVMGFNMNVPDKQSQQHWGRGGGGWSLHPSPSQANVCEQRGRGGVMSMRMFTHNVIKFST